MTAPFAAGERPFPQKSLSKHFFVKRGRLRVPSSQEVYALVAAAVIVVATAAVVSTAAAVAASAATVVAAATAVAAAAEQDQDDDQDHPHVRAVVIIAPHNFVHLTCHALHYPMREMPNRSLTIEKGEKIFTGSIFFSRRPL